MRIGLDATRLNQPTGEGTYTREVICHLIKAFPDDIFFVVVSRFEHMFDFPNVEQIVYREVDGILERMFHAFAIGQITKKYNLDIYHNLTNYAAFGASCPVVTNVMDLVSLKFPAVRGSRLHGLIYRYIFPALLRRSQRIIAISECTRSDINKYYGLTEKVRTIPCGINHEKFNISKTLSDKLLNRFDLPPDYLLFVGYLSPKKNLGIVLSAMHKLASEDFETHLVLVGKRGYGSESIFELAKSLGLEERVIETGFVSDDELTLLYRKAGLFVFPSIYEGFGLPVLEAMACGVPVLVSSAGPPPDLVGDSGYVCDPYNVNCWANKIRTTLTTPQARVNSHISGPKRAALFSWHECALQLRKVYSEAILEYQGLRQ